jgi:hypothetical protein
MLSYLKSGGRPSLIIYYVQGAEYVYESDWGEQLTSVVNPLPVVLDIQSEECTIIDISKLGDISGK